MHRERAVGFERYRAHSASGGEERAERGQDDGDDSHGTSSRSSCRTGPAGSAGPVRIPIVLLVWAVRDAEAEVGVADVLRPGALPLAGAERQSRGRQAALIPRGPDVLAVGDALARPDVVLPRGPARLPAGLLRRR